MTAPAYTPGPWITIADEEEGTVRIEACDLLRTRVAEIQPLADDDETEANARLMARAPSMHDALGRIHSLLQSGDPQRAMSIAAAMLTVINGGFR